MGRFIVYPAIAVAAILFCAAPARAQANRTFVSGQGSDSNPCTLPAPCRSLTAAVAATNAGGEVTMLDPAGYGRVTITKAISIVNDGGGEAGITDPGFAQNAIVIQAGASDVVNLRGLTLNGVGTGFSGIVFASGGALNVQNCVIRGFTGTGLAVQLSGSLGSAEVTISDTIVSDNTVGIEIETETGTITAQLERVAATGNQFNGFTLFGNSPSGVVRATIVDSVAADNVAGGSGAYGFQANRAATVTLVNSRAVHNGIGIGSVLGATMYISETTVLGNTINGFQKDAGSSLQTFGDNYIIDTNNTGSLTPIALQ